MDDAEMRRGKTSVHEKFGEGLAVLVAIGFLNASYGLVFVNHANLPERAMLAHAELVECIGAAGMVGGQAVDLALATGAGSSKYAESESVRNLKTSALMRLAIRVGAILAGANPIDLVKLSRFAELLGDAYQLSDDLIDFEEDDALFTNKTFVGESGREAARVRLAQTIDDAKRILVENFEPGEARSCLIQFADYLGERRS